MADNKKVIISVVINDASAKTKLKEISDETKNLGNGADKASKGFLGLGKTLTAIARGFVIVKSFQLLARAVTESVKILADFELSMAKVKAITNATDEEFKKLEQSAKDLALGTMFTATQVAELQLAYSKLGFTTEEILNATEATTRLATITGDDLANSADVVGSVLRGFNLTASESIRVVDVMASSFSSSALNLENFRQSMKTVAPIANAANISLEQTTAMLSVLADAGLRGTVAATGLKNILSKLTDPTSDLSKELGYTVNSAEGVSIAFDDLVKKNIDLAKATGLTDERSKAAFLTLIKGKERIDELTEAYENNINKSKEMADIVENTLSVSWDKFGSAVEGFVLREGAGFEKFLTRVLNETSEYINRLDSAYRKQQALQGIREVQSGGLNVTQIPLQEVNSELEWNLRLLESSQEELKKLEEDYVNTYGVVSQLLDKSFPFLTKLFTDKNEAELQLQTERDLVEGYKERTEELKKQKESSEKLLSDDILAKQEIERQLRVSKQYLKTRIEAGGVSEIELNHIRGIVSWWEDLLKLRKEPTTPTTPTGETDEERKARIKGYEEDAKHFESWSETQLKARIRIREIDALMIDDIDAREKALIDAAKQEKVDIMQSIAFKKLDGAEKLKVEKELDLKIKKLEDDAQARRFAQYDKDQEEYQKYLDKEEEANEKRFEKTKELTEKFNQEQLDLLYEQIEKSAQLYDQLTGLFVTFVDNKLNATIRANELQFQSFKETQDKELSLFDINQKHQLDTFIGSESAKADFEKQKGLERLEFEKKQSDAEKALRKKQIDEENRIRKQAFVAEKINSIAQIGINTAVAVSQAWKTGGITIPLIIASGAVGVATVLAKQFQPTTYEDGGIVKGALHRDGGVPFTVKGQGGFEMEGGEYIMSRKAVNKVGVDFLDRINFDGKAPDNSYMFANGGVVPRVQNNAINQAELADMIGEAIAMRISQIPVVNVATDTSSISRKVFNAQSMATF